MAPEKYLFPLLAFTIPLIIRAIPEILMGQYLVGFDSMAYYVPTTQLWLDGGVTVWSFIAIAPLLYTMTAGLTLISGSITLVLKILAPILLGFLGLSIYGYAKHGLGWSTKKSIAPALIGTLYFVALRISWDALREEIALIFLFTMLTLLTTAEASGRFSWKHYLAFSLAAIAVVLSNQVVAALMLGLLLFTAIHNMIRRKPAETLNLVLFSTPAVAIFFAMFFLSPVVPEYRLIFGFPATNDGWLALFGYPSYQAMITSEIGFILYCFLPILPLALLSARRFVNFQMRSWIFLIILVVFIPMVSPSPLRLLMLLTFPLAFYVTEGLAYLKSIKWRRYKITLFRVGLVYLISTTILLSGGFMVTTAEAPFTYFDSKVNPYVYDIPTSMLQNTIALEDCPSTTNALQWLKENMTSNGVLLSHRVFFGWALSTFNRDQIIMYEYGNPDDAAAKAIQEGHTQIYLIWWVNGLGWEGQPTVPSTFHEVYQNGKIAIYIYSS